MSGFWARESWLDPPAEKHEPKGTERRRGDHESARRKSTSSRSHHGDGGSRRGSRNSIPGSPTYSERSRNFRSPPRRRHSREDEYSRSRSRPRDDHRHHEEEYVVAFRKEYDLYCRESREKLREEPFSYLRWLEINKRTPGFYEKYQKYRKKELEERKSPLSYMEWQKYRKHVKDKKAGGWSGYKPHEKHGQHSKHEDMVVIKVPKKKDKADGPLEPGEVPSSDEEEEVFVPSSSAPSPPPHQKPRRDPAPHPPKRDRPAQAPNHRPPFERRNVSQPEPKKECPVVMIEPQVRDLIASRCLDEAEFLNTPHPPGSIHHKPPALLPTPSATDATDGQPTETVPQIEQVAAVAVPTSPKPPTTSQKSPVKGSPSAGRGGGKTPGRGGGPRPQRPHNSTPRGNPRHGGPGRGPRPQTFGAPRETNPNFIPLGPPRNPFAPPSAEPWYGPPQHDYGPPPEHHYGPPPPPHPGYGPRPPVPGYGHDYYPAPSYERPQYPGYGPPRPSPPRYDYPGYGPPRPPPPGHDPYGYGGPSPGQPQYPPYEDPYYRGYGHPPPPPPPGHPPPHDPYAYPPGHPAHYGQLYPPHHPPPTQFAQPPPPPLPIPAGHQDPYGRYETDDSNVNEPEFDEDPQDEPMPETPTKENEPMAGSSSAKEKDPEISVPKDDQTLGLKTLKLQELVDRKREDLFQLTRLKKNSAEFKQQYDDWMSKYEVWKQQNIHHPMFQSINSEWEGWRIQLVKKMKTTEEMVAEASERIKVIDQLQLLLTTGDVDENIELTSEPNTSKTSQRSEWSSEPEPIDRSKTNDDNLRIEFPTEKVINLSRETREKFLIVVQECRQFLNYMDSFDLLYPRLPPLM